MSPAADRPNLSTTTSKAPSITTVGKRKRDSTSNIPTDISPNNSQDDKDAAQLHLLLKDAVEILKRSVIPACISHPGPHLALLISPLSSHDVTPSILHHPLPSSLINTPATKRVKLSSVLEDRTIAQRVEASEYKSVSDFSKDLDSAVASVIGRLESTTLNGEVDDSHRNRHERHPDAVRAIAFKQEFNNIILRELLQRPHLMSIGGSEVNQSSSEEATSGKDDIQPVSATVEEETSYSNVLTLFGGSGSGSGQPKQLFSSLKDTQRGPNRGINGQKNAISEAGLPNGITFTKIVPVHSQGEGEQKEVPTIGKLFAPPPHIQPLNPPRQSRHTATRSSSVNWYNPAEITTPSRPTRRDSYSTQPLTAGQWLTYNVIPSTKDLASPETKRKQRDRALSFGEPQTELSEKTLTLHRRAKDDALFRSVYSGFAPDQDNTGALVPQQSKNRIWWKRVGEQRFLNSIIGARQAPYYDSVDPPPIEDVETAADEQEMSLEEAVRTWEPAAAPADFVAEDQEEGDDANPKGMEEMLNDISELLETLNSYQDVRNLSLANSVRATTGQNAQLSAMTGTPASPSPEEMELHNMLKSQLSIMISSLPPFALSKLDGQKLGKLNISTKIQMDTRSFKGSLEEDEISTRGRQPSATDHPSRTTSAAVGLAPRNNYSMATSTPSAPSHRASHMPQTAPARATAPSSYLHNPQYAPRPPSANQYFAQNARPSYTGQRPIASSTPDRYPYSGSQQYSHTAGRQSYANGYNQYTNPNGTSYGQGYAQSQSQAMATGNRASQAPYPPASRPTQSYGYAATPTPSGGSMSPSKAGAQYGSHGYGGPGGTPSQGRPPAYHQHSSQYNHQGSASPLINGTGMGGARSPPVQQSNGDHAPETQLHKAGLQETQARGSSTHPGQGMLRPVNGTEVSR
ncbi:MAG: hypothetical protein Q9168_005408 [Polycauliona sp. 1 TL-2023]